MHKLQLSHYTSALPGNEGELILVNSFMGALCRIAAEHRPFLEAGIRDGFEEPLPADLAFLKDHGYLIDADIPEVDLVTELLARERDRNGMELIVLPHENCNFRCTYCYESFARGKMRSLVVRGLKRLVAKEAATWGRVHISWFGGEPLLARDVICDLSDAFLKSCADAGVGYSSAMTTNGYFLTPDVAGDLLARKVNFFQITVDGPATAHNARRHLAGGGDTYERVMANLLALHARTDPFTVRLRVNFDPGSVDDITAWIADIAPAFAGDERFHLAFHPIGRWGGPHDADLQVCDEDSAWQLRNALFEQSLEAGFAADTYRNFLSSHGSTCYAGRKSSIVVGSDGRLYKCTVAFDDPRNHVGWLNPEGALDLDMDRWRLWVETDHLDTGKCGGCWFNASCQSRSCPLVALDNGEPPCPSHREEMERIALVSAYAQPAATAAHAHS